MSVITLSSEQVAALEREEELYVKPRALRHTNATKWHMICMAVLFMFEFMLSVSITYLLYTNDHHTACYISITFITLFYIIGLLLGFTAITSQSPDSFLLCMICILCGVVMIPICLPFIICVFCVKEAMQNYSKMQLLVNIIPLFMYITAQWILQLFILSTMGVTLSYNFDAIGNMPDKKYDLSWMISLSVFVCILFYIDVFTLILFHGGHIMTKYHKSAKFMTATLSLEFLLITICILVRFYVDDWGDVDTTHQAIVEYALYNYFIFSLPFSAIRYIWRWIKHLEYHSYIEALVNEKMKIMESDLYDRFYAYFHLQSHTALPRKSMKPFQMDKYYNVNYDLRMEDTKMSTSLLSSYSFARENDSDLRRHCGGDFICFKYQHEYFGKDLKSKKKYIKKISHGKLPKLSVWKRFLIYRSNKCTGSTFFKFIYICSRTYSYIFPIYWFFGVYFHTEELHHHFHDGSLWDWLIDSHNKFEHLFVIAILIIYTICLYIFVRSIYLFLKIEYYYGYIMGLKIYWKEIDHFNRFLHRNKTIMNSVQCNRYFGDDCSYKISCIIISYLKNNHSSYNWILSSRI